jgi:hypothetical protein
VSTFPAEGMALTHILVEADVERSRRWYADVLGASLFREYGGTSAVFTFAGGCCSSPVAGRPRTSPT